MRGFARGVLGSGASRLASAVAGWRLGVRGVGVCVGLVLGVWLVCGVGVAFAVSAYRFGRAIGTTGEAGGGLGLRAPVREIEGSRAIAGSAVDGAGDLFVYDSREMFEFNENAGFDRNFHVAEGYAGGSSPKVLTRAQKLTSALKACRRDRQKRKRVSCERQAHKRYGPLHKPAEKRKPAKKTSRKGGGR
jgi:hypothetical protein